MKKRALATALMLTITAGAANAYQAEVGATLGYVDAGDGTLVVGVDGTYYLQPVQTKDLPLNEAAFLNRASNVYGSLAYADNDLTDVTTIGAGVEYFVPNSDFYLHAGAGLNQSDVIDTTTYLLEAGYLPVSNFLLAAGISGTRVDGGSNSSDPLLRAKYVTNVSGYDVNLEGGLTFADDTAFTLGGDVYLDKTFSIGASYFDSGVKDVDGIFSIRAKKFFTPQVSLGANIDLADEANAFTLRGAYRF